MFKKKKKKMQFTIPLKSLYHCHKVFGNKNEKTSIRNMHFVIVLKVNRQSDRF